MHLLVWLNVKEFDRWDQPVCVIDMLENGDTSPQKKKNMCTFVFTGSLDNLIGNACVR